MRTKLRNLALCLVLATAPAAAVTFGFAAPASAECTNGTNWDGTCK